MVGIPEAQTIATPAPRPSMDVPQEYPRQIYRPGEEGAAISGLAEGVTADAGKLLDQQDQMQFATARSAFLQKKASIENSFAADQDWHTIPQRYQQAMSEAASETMGSIENPKYQAQFKMQSGDEIAAGGGAMLRLARGKQVDAARGSLANTLESNRVSALSSPDNAPALIQSTLGAISGAAANGFITADEAVNERQKWTANYGKGWLMIQPDSKQAELLSDPTAKTGTPADFVDPAERVVMAREANNRLKTDGAVAQQQFAQTAADQVAYLRSGGDPSKVAITPENAYAVYGHTPQGDAVAGEITRARKYNGLVREMALAPQGQINEILTRNAPTGPGATGAMPINDAIHGQESGNNPNAPTSVNGAVGIGQMMPATFKQFATASEDINNPGDNIAVSNRAIDAYSKKYNGDASRVAVAYFSGEGNVSAAGSATPWKVNSKDGNGKTVAGYVAAVTGRVGGASGFREQQQDYNDLREIAVNRSKALASDPASYAVSADPQTGQAYLDAQKSPQAFDAYVARLNGTYTALGQPTDQRSILPVGDAVATVKSLNTVAPGDAVKQIDSLKQTSGRWWPQVYSELAKNGLPPAFQAVTVASPQDAQVMVAAMQTGKGHASVGVGVSEDDKKLGGTIDTALDENADLRNLRGSLTAYGRSGVDLYGGTRQAVRQTAMYLMDQNPSLSAADATARAAGMVAGQFDFMPQGNNPPARLPKGSLDHAQMATASAIATLKPGSVRPYPASPSALSPAPDGQAEGLVTPGNIDLAARPTVKNSDGSISTVRSITIQTDHGAVLLPTVIGDKVVSNAQAIAAYKKSGENLGTFQTEAQADAYAQSLHQSQAAYYGGGGPAGRGEASADERSQAALHGAQNAWWLTVPASDGGTILRAIDSTSGLPVILANGQKLDVRVSSGTGAVHVPDAAAPVTVPIGAADVAAASGRKLPAAGAMKIPKRGR